ncbi:Protein Gawky like protein [Argiope bruennichi]|uniref:Protein Gawky like protein n=1 Tax=Argiope bruennichi TaxID=94029 RepID=A0A8T0G4P1_ARGBR|nr:Protein Gawky like protein [Argiope bruennichi]
MDSTARYGDASASAFGAAAYRSNPSYNFNQEGENGNSDSSYSGWQNGSNWSDNNKNNRGKDENMDHDNNSFSGLLGATGGQEEKGERRPPMPRLGLLGGGESSMVGSWSGSQGPSSTGAWAGRPGTTDISGGSNAETPTKPSQTSSWAQAAGKGLPGEPTQEAPTSSRDRAEQEAQEFRKKAAFSQGWGQNGVNQDTPWDVDDNTQDGSKESTTWRAPNNGTEIWETNLRMNKGGAPAVATPTTAPPPPWGHTPATNIGGHWGEEEQSSSQWQSGGGTMPNPTHWPDNNNTGSSMWGGSTGQEKHWNNNQSQWGDGSSEASWSSRNRPLGNWSPAATPKKEVPPSGWEPPSPPPLRRSTTGAYDDGTAAWGNPQRQGKVSHWKDMPTAKPISGGMPIGPSGMPGMLRIPGKGGDNGSWTKPQPTGTGRNSWQDMPTGSMGNWNDDPMKNVSQAGQYVGWNDPNNSVCWGAKPKANSNWADGQVDTSSWLGPAKQGGKPLCKDIVHASKQFRILTEMGYRKEDVENALRNSNMNYDEAIMELHALHPGVMEVDGFGGRKVRPANPYEDMNTPDHNMDSSFTFHPPSNNFHNFTAQHNFKQPPPKGPTGVVGGQSPQLGTSNMSPALIQKLLQQQQQQQQQSLQLMNLNNVQPLDPNLKPKCKLRTCAEIKGSTGGHLNAQILNQPLAPSTLQLLYQLLQQIKTLSNLQQVQKQGGHCSMQVTQCKTRIVSLQNQICAQQAIFLKQQQLPPQQQQQQQTLPLQQPHPTGVSDLFKPPPPDSLPGLHSDFRDLTLKDHHNQSRLNQWKSPMDKDDEDFSRAPGSLHSKSHPLLDQHVQSDSTWSGGRNDSVGGWPDSTNTDNSTTAGPSADNNKDDGQGSGYNLTDLVPEFEPGKPWKGTQMKSVEDDPHITPGSIARSPLSVNNIKDSNLFWPSKSSPANNDLPANTWGYSAPSANGTSSVKGGKSSWSSGDFGTDSWGSSLPKSTARNNPTSSQGWDRQFNSTFLILKNLTPQIDGSTLKTLCMQHGPLQMFHLFLNRGVALVRYNSHEEAAKAQSALNNCVLSNTTMLAELPSDAEVQQYLQSAQGGGASTNSWPAPSSASSFYGGGASVAGTASWNAAPNNTSQLWSFSGSSLWSQPSNDHDASTNPINYLPNDLLGAHPAYIIAKVQPLQDQTSELFAERSSMQRIPRSEPKERTVFFKWYKMLKFLKDDIF